MIKNNE